MFQASTTRNLVKATSTKLTTSSTKPINASRSISTSEGSFAFYPARRQLAPSSVPSVTTTKSAGNRDCWSYYSQQAAPRSVSSMQNRNMMSSWTQSSTRSFSTDAIAFYPVQKNRIRATSARKIERDCYSFYPSKGLDLQARNAMKEARDAAAKAEAAQAEAIRAAASIPKKVVITLPKKKVSDQFKSWDATGVLNAMKKRSTVVSAHQ